MTQFDHDAVQGTDLSGEGEEEELDTLEDTEVEGAVKVGDTVDDVVPPSSEQSPEQE